MRLEKVSIFQFAIAGSYDLVKVPEGDPVNENVNDTKNHPTEIVYYFILSVTSQTKNSPTAVAVGELLLGQI